MSKESNRAKPDLKKLTNEELIARLYYSSTVRNARNTLGYEYEELKSDGDRKFNAYLDEVSRRFHR